MNQAEIICTLLIVVAALAMLAKKVALPYPVLLVIGGLALGFVPGLPAVQLEPDMVFLLLLPPLLYPAALYTSWRDFRANLSPISLLAIGLVLFTTAFVAMVAHALRGLPWPAAFVLGAIISPTDAVAATAITDRLRVPRRIVTILDGESSPQRRDGACRLPFRSCGDDERKLFAFRSQRALCFSRTGRHGDWVGCRLARFPPPAPS
jgi:NhaP-type Na+/H+ or K+/H+ antiporter